MSVMAEDHSMLLLRRMPLVERQNRSFQYQLLLVDQALGWEPLSTMGVGSVILLETWALAGASPEDVK